MTQVVSNIKDWKHVLTTSLKNKSIGFVPTMGALHAGHIELMKRSLSENEITVASIFVNPTQFNNSEDLAKYPRTLEKDLDMLSEVGINYLFAPDFSEMYPDKYSYKVSESEFSKLLCGKFRPGHFDGVLTIVMKLFNIIQPQKAYFGEKDFQQMTLIQGMVNAFFMNLEIVPVPTIRESSGLALSSRNMRLSKDGIVKAQKFAQILSQKKPLNEIHSELNKNQIEIEYLEEINQRRFAAVSIEGVRLIDNV